MVVHYNENGVTQLYKYARRGAIVPLKQLLLKKAGKEQLNCKQKNKSQSTALHAAFYNGHYEVAQILLKLGADCNIINAFHESPLDNAIWPKNGALPPLAVAEVMARGSLDIVRRARKRMANSKIHINTHLPCGWTMMHCACRSGNLEVVEYCVRKGASPTAVTAPFLGEIREVDLRDSTDWNLNSNALHIAALGGCYEVVTYLTGIMNPNQVWLPQNKYQMTALRCLSYSPVEIREGNRNEYFQAFKSIVQVSNGAALEELIKGITNTIAVLQKPHPKCGELVPLPEVPAPLGLVGTPLSPLPEGYEYEGSLVSWLHVDTSPYSPSELNFPLLRKTVSETLNRIKADLLHLFNTDDCTNLPDFDWACTLLSYLNTNDAVECLLAGVMFATSEYRDRSTLGTTLTESFVSGKKKDLDSPAAVRIRPILWRLKQLIDSLAPTDPKDLMYATDASWNACFGLGQVIYFAQFCVVNDISTIQQHGLVMNSSFLFVASSGPRIDFLYNDRISRKIHNIETPLSIRYVMDHALLMLLYWANEFYVLREEPHFTKPNQKLSTQKGLIKIIRESSIHMSRHVLFKNNWGIIDMKLKNKREPEGLRLEDVYKSWISESGPRVICVSGGNGSGKSTMATRIFQLVTEDDTKRDKPLLPVFVPLLRLGSLKVSAYAMHQLGVAPSCCAELLFSTYNLVLILDGLENMPREMDNTLTNAYKIFITAGATFLELANYSVPAAFSFDCDVYSILPLTEEQRLRHFGKQSTCKDTWLPDNEIEILRNKLKKSGVWEIITTPLLLGLAGECKDGVKDHSMKTSVNISLQTAYGVLYSFVELCATQIAVEASCSECCTEGQVATPKKNAQHQQKEVARIFQQGSKVACHQLTVGRWQLPATDQTFTDISLLEGVPSLTVDPLSFEITHIFNFFVAYTFMRSPKAALMHPLGRKRFTRTHLNIVDLIEANVSSLPWKPRELVKELLPLVLASRYGENPPSSNALALLVKCRAPIDCVDFSGINIAEANLSGGSFNNVSFKNATFQNCDFTRAHFRRCDFTNCTFGGKAFGTVAMALGCEEYTCLDTSTDLYVLLGTRGGVVKQLHAADLATQSLCASRAEPVSSTCYSPDKKMLAFSLKKRGIVRIINSKNNTEIEAICFNDPVHHIKFTPDSKSLIIASTNDILFIHELAGKEKRILAGHTKPIRNMCLAQEAWLLVTCSEDGTVRVWNLQNKKEVKVKKYDNNDPRIVGISPNGTYIGVIDNTTLKVTNILTDKRIHLTNKPSTNVAFSPENRVAVAHYNLIQIFELATREKLQLFDGHSTPINFMMFTKNALVSLSSDSVLCLWDYNGSRLPLMGKGNGKVLCHSLSEDGKIAITGSSDNSIRLWNATTGGLLKRLKGHRSPVTVVRFSPNNKIALSGSEDDTVRTWDIFTGTMLTTMKHPAEVAAAAFSSDGRLIISGCRDECARIWCTESGKLIHTLEGHGATVNIVFFSEKDRVVKCGAANSTYRVWNTESGKTLQAVRAELEEEVPTPKYNHELQFYCDTVCVVDKSKNLPDIKRTAVFPTGSTRHVTFIDCSNVNVKPRSLAALFEVFTEES